METKFIEWLRETHREREKATTSKNRSLANSLTAVRQSTASWQYFVAWFIQQKSRLQTPLGGALSYRTRAQSPRITVTGFYLLYTCKTIWNVSRTKRSKNKYSLYATQNSLKMYEMCASEKDIYVQIVLPSPHSSLLSSTLPQPEHRARPWGQTKFSLQAESRFDCLPPCLPSCLTVWKRICDSASRPPDDLSIVGKLSATLPPDRLPAKWQVRHVG